MSRVILCRNLAFTYFAEPLQHEQLPPTTLLEPWIPALGIHRHVPHRPERR